MPLLPTKSKIEKYGCKHGFRDFCPHGCFQTEFEQAIMEMMKGSAPDTEEGLLRILRYKEAQARQTTAELSQVLGEIAEIQERLSDIRRKKWNSSSSNLTS